MTILNSNSAKRVTFLRQSERLIITNKFFPLFIHHRNFCSSSKKTFSVSSPQKIEATEIARQKFKF